MVGSAKRSPSGSSSWGGSDCIGFPSIRYLGESAHLFASVEGSARSHLCCGIDNLEVVGEPHRTPNSLPVRSAPAPWGLGPGLRPSGPRAVPSTILCPLPDSPMNVRSSTHLIRAFINASRQRRSPERDQQYQTHHWHVWQKTGIVERL